MIRKLIVCLTALVLVGASLGINASPGLANTHAKKSFNWKRFSGQSINVLFDEHPWADGVAPYLNDFTKLTGIKVNVQKYAEDLYFDKMELAVRSSKSVADVYFEPMDSTAYTQWAAHDIASITPFLRDPSMTMPGYDLKDFPKGFTVVARFPPGNTSPLYGIPITFETYILFYNKDLVKKYLGGKLPKTMSGLVAAAQKISKEGKGQVYGAVMRGIRSDTIMDTLSGVVFDAWGKQPTPLPYNLWFNGSWMKPRMTDPRIVQGLSYYAGLMKAGPPNILSMDWYEDNQLFQQGRAAFYIDASLFAPGFEDPKKSRVAGKVGYSALPPSSRGSDTGHWMWGLGIPKNSTHQGAAWYFIQWATSKMMEPKIGRMTGGAPRLSSWKNPVYTKALPAGYVKAVRSVMLPSRPTAVFRENWKQFALMIVDAVHSMYSGTPPKKACAQLQANVLKAMKSSH